MNSIIRLTLIAFMACYYLSGQAQITFEKLIPGVHQAVGWDVVQTSDSGYVVCGDDYYYYGQWPNYAGTLIKTDQHGNKLWSHLYGLSFENHLYSVRETSDGGLIACGSTWADTMMNSLLLSTDSEGEILYIRSYPIRKSGSFARSVRQCDDQGFIICGSVYPDSSETGMRSYLLKTNSDGDTIWNRLYSSPIDEYGVAVICLPDSGFALLSINSDNTEGNTILRKLDGNGIIEWEKIYPAILGADLAKINNDGYIIVGTKLSEPYDKIGLIRTNSSGDSTWFKVFPEQADGNSVAVTEDGGFLVGGTIYNSPDIGLHQLYLLRTNPNGDPVWTRKWGGTSSDYGASVAVTFDSGYIFTGYTRKPNTDTILVYLIKGNEDSTTIGVFEQTSREELYLYPNPSNGILNIRLHEPAEDILLEIRDILGNSVYSERISQVSNVLSRRIPVERSGIYLVTIRTPEYSRTGKVLIHCRDNHPGPSGN